MTLNLEQGLAETPGGSAAVTGSGTDRLPPVLHTVRVVSFSSLSLSLLSHAEQGAAGLLSRGPLPL